MSGFHGYRFPSQRLARIAWEQTERAMRATSPHSFGGGGGLWRIRDETTGSPCVIFYDGETDRLERLVRGIGVYRRAEPWPVPADLQETLLVRRARTAVEELVAGRIRPDGVIDQRGRYAGQGPAGGLFLHRDGALHPFPEPSGEG